mmetsp:Transcript_42884/g.142775  ORF Transcript_42884/g.142775 Transcript_42884/m.142775 type:complete len:239 (+) Transcript_42884:97-813(+)
MCACSNKEVNPAGEVRAGHTLKATQSATHGPGWTTPTPSTRPRGSRSVNQPVAPEVVEGDVDDGGGGDDDPEEEERAVLAQGRRHRPALPAHPVERRQPRRRVLDGARQQQRVGDLAELEHKDGRHAVEHEVEAVARPQHGARAGKEDPHRHRGPGQKQESVEARACTRCDAALRATHAAHLVGPHRLIETILHAPRHAVHRLIHTVRVDRRLLLAALLLAGAGGRLLCWLEKVLLEH